MPSWVAKEKLGTLLFASEMLVPIPRNRTVGGRDGEHRDSGYEDGIRTTPWRISLDEDGPICGNALKAVFGKIGTRENEQAAECNGCCCLRVCQYSTVRKGGIVVIDPGNISNQIIRVRLAVHALELGARSEPWMIV